MSTDNQWFLNATDEQIVSVSRVESLNPIDWQKARTAFASFDELCKATPGALQAAGLSNHQATCLSLRNKGCAKELLLLSEHGIKIVRLGDPRYPTLLAEINDPPLWLFYRGSLDAIAAKTITVVGTRKPTAYATAVMDRIFTSTLLRGLTTVSGLAYGIDQYIHNLSLKALGRTVAVLAGGLDVIYPTAHTNLAKRIVESGGLLLSEYPPLVRPQPYRFPIRNRIVAGLSPLTAIIEAKIQSGTLTTAKSAVDYNRDVYAIPGDITRESAQGGNLLIQNGAHLLCSSEQIAQYYNISIGGARALQLDTEEAQLLHLLTDQGLTLDQIVTATGKKIENILGLVTQLELMGAIVVSSDGCYTAK